MARRHTGRRQHGRKHRRQTHRRHSHRRQQGGAGSCAAMPQNTASFGLVGGRRRHSHRRQRGGMAPWSTGPALLLDGSARVQAEQGPLDSYIAELPSVIPKMGGGRRRSHRRHSHRRHRHRKQKGGMSPYNAPAMLLERSQYAHAGQNPQFTTEASVNPLYGPFRGAQQP
jgi:hypothetical protein